MERSPLLQGRASPHDLEHGHERVCWICLDHSGNLAQPCRCPRFSHPECLARWQRTNLGRAREAHCEFCRDPLPHWSAGLPADERFHYNVRATVLRRGKMMAAVGASVLGFMILSFIFLLGSEGLREQDEGCSKGGGGSCLRRNVYVVLLVLVVLLVIAGTISWGLVCWRSLTQWARDT
eukprot:tig00000989_g6093.t1